MYTDEEFAIVILYIRIYIYIYELYLIGLYIIESKLNYKINTCTDIYFFFLF